MAARTKAAAAATKKKATKAGLKPALVVRKMRVKDVTELAARFHGSRKLGQARLDAEAELNERAQQGLVPTEIPAALQPLIDGLLRERDENVRAAIKKAHALDRLTWVERRKHQAGGSR